MRERRYKFIDGELTMKTWICDFEQMGAAEALMTYADEYQAKQEMTFKKVSMGSARY